MVVLAILIVATTPPTYQAAARIMLVRDDVSSIDTIGTTDALTNNDVRSAEQVLASRSLANKVVDTLDLAQNPAFTMPPVATTDVVIATVMGWMRAGVDFATGFLDPVTTASSGGDAPESGADETDDGRREAAQTLQNEMEVSRVGESSAIEVAYQIHDPSLAASIVNTYTDVFLTDQLETAIERSGRTTQWLQARLDELEQDAREAAAAAQQFRIENDLVTVRDELVSGGNVDRFNIDLTEARTEAARLRARVEAYEEALAVEPAELAENDDLRLSLPGGERLNTLRERLGTLETRRSEVIRNFGSDHPQASNLDIQIDAAAQRLYSEMARQAEIARGELKVAETQVASLETALEPVMETNDDASRALVELRVLEQRAEALFRLYEAFLLKSQEADQFTSFPASNVRILSMADVPENPISPSTTRGVLLGVALALFFGTIHAAWREWRDRSIRTGSDVTDILGTQFFGYLPVLKRGDRCSMRNFEEKAAKARAKGKPDPEYQQSHRPKFNRESGTMPVLEVPLAGLGNPYSPFCETLRNIRNAVNRAQSRREGNVIGITSLTTGEGKSFVSTDFADIVSMQSKRTLLVDCDPRRLGLSRALGLTGTMSMTSVLRSDAEWREALVRIDGTHVDVLGWSTETPIQNPSELLGSHALHEVILDAAQSYDWVVLDLPPLGPVVDVREMLPRIDYLLLLARWGQTPTGALKTILDEEPDLRARLLGTALNMVDLKALRRYVAPSATTYYDEYSNTNA